MSSFNRSYNDAMVDLGAHVVAAVRAGELELHGRDLEAAYERANGIATAIHDSILDRVHALADNGGTPCPTP